MNHEYKGLLAVPELPPVTEEEEVALNLERAPLLKSLVDALAEGNRILLRQIVDLIQNTIQEPLGNKSTPISDSSLDDLIQRGRLEIGVGANTMGTRIYINDGEIWMTEPVNILGVRDPVKGLGARESQLARVRFNHLFSLSKYTESKIRFTLPKSHS